MKDLQEYFDSQMDEVLEELSNVMDQEKMSRDDAVRILNIMNNVYKAETGKQLPEEEKQLLKLFEKFKLDLGLYINVRDFRMTVKGRIALSSEDYSFSLTERGREYVENKILPKLKN